MKSSDSGNPQRVVLYVRVSTEEQARSGYSIPEQLGTLTAHAEREGWEIVGEPIVDDGYSGASPDRPGIRRIYKLAEAGEIDLVLATKRDRFFRSRLYMLTTSQDLKDYGVTLVSLTDTGNMIGDSVLDSFAEYEHQVIRERTVSGKVQKARAGKVVGGPERAYGYSWVKDGDGKTVGYEPNETEMGTVRYIFAEVAAGTGIRTIRNLLDDEHVPSREGSKAWNRHFIRDLLMSDLYKPHTVEELRALGVSEEVVSRLDADSVYGVYRYQGIPVPILDAGILLETVLQARRKTESYVPPSRNAGRFWELSGGVLYCSECGRRIQTQSIATGSNTGRLNYYYKCQSTTNGRGDRCGMRKHVRADIIEPKVWDMVRVVMDDKHYLLDRLEEHFEQRRRELRRPGAPDVALLKQRERREALGQGPGRLRSWLVHLGRYQGPPRGVRRRARGDRPRARAQPQPGRRVSETERRRGRDAPAHRGGLRGPRRRHPGEAERGLRGLAAAGRGRDGQGPPHQRDVPRRPLRGPRRHAGNHARPARLHRHHVQIPDRRPPPDGPRHAVYARDSSGNFTSQNVVSSGSGRTS